MRPISIQELLQAVRGQLLQSGETSAITGVSTNSRSAGVGDLFIPLIGERFDGHRFIQDAAASGAAAILTQQSVTCPGKTNVIAVENTLTALQALARYYLERFKIPVIAVTGSTGKTTTKDMTAAVLSQKYQVLKTRGNFNNEIGLPLTVFQLEDNCDYAVLEMGMSGFGEIRRLVGIAPPAIGIITNIGVSHIEKLGSRENILKAKMEMFEGSHAGCTALLNGDDDLLRAAARQLAHPVLFYGIRNQADISASNIVNNGEDGTQFTLTMDGVSHEMVLPAPGLHNVYNALAAATAGMLCGLSAEAIQAGLLTFESGQMRLSIFETRDKIKVIDDAYNASPDSMKAALAVLRDFPGRRKIAVLGDMLELGDYAEEGHRTVGRAAASCGVSILAAKGDKGALVAEEALRAGLSADAVGHFDSNEAVIRWLHTRLLPGDTILVKGSRGMKMEEITAYLKERG